MHRLSFELLFIFLTISVKNNVVMADLLDTSSSVVGLYQFGEEMMQKFFSQPDDNSFIKIGYSLHETNYKIRLGLKSVLARLEENLAKISLSDDFKALKTNFLGIEDTFIKLLHEQTRVNNHFIEGYYYYQDLNNDWEKLLDDYWRNIRSVVTEKTGVSSLTPGFYKNLEKYTHVCQTNKSHLQLLDELLTSYTLVTSEYVLSRNFLYNFLEIGHEGKYADERKQFNEETLEKYNKDVEDFKTIMSSASTELWKCDRYNVKGNSSSGISADSYYELKAFTKYYTYEENFENYTHCFPNKCAPKVQKCIGVHHLGQGEEVCEQTRFCSNILIRCNKINLDSDTGLSLSFEKYSKYFYHVCMNEEKGAYNRYTSVIPASRRKYNTMATCPKTLHKEFHSYFNTIIVGSLQFYYECVCPENDYFISSAPANAKPGHIIVGAKLEMLNNILYIRIKEGKLLPNGTVDRSTVQWNEIDTERSAPIIGVLLDTVIDLASIQLPNDRVITGLGFKINHRVFLSAYSTKFDFKTGVLFENDTVESFRFGTNYLDLSDSDASTKSKEPNNLHTADDYVKISLSSLEKDGGQSTIPFIDTQEVIPNPPVPLSGISLYLRRQEGFGGFLALKLFTYNIEPYVQPVPSLDFDFTGKIYSTGG